MISKKNLRNLARCRALFEDSENHGIDLLMQTMEVIEETLKIAGYDYKKFDREQDLELEYGGENE